MQGVMDGITRFTGLKFTGESYHHFMLSMNLATLSPRQAS
jgi:hypothetical protein